MHHRKILLLATILACGFLTINPLRAADADAIKESSTKWLNFADTGDFFKTWELGSANLQANSEKMKWVDTMKKLRDSLGAVRSRVLQSGSVTEQLFVGGSGPMATLRYITDFESKVKAQEVVMLLREPDGDWRVAGYLVK